MVKVSLKVTSALLLLTLIAVSIVYSRAVHSESDVKATLAVAVKTISKQNQYEVERFFPATAEAQQTVAVGSELSGKLSSVLVDDGDRVTKGTTLFTLDTQLLQTQKQALKANANQVLPEIELVKKRIKRQSELKQQSFASEDNLDALNAQLNALNANYASLQAQISDIEIRIDKSTVKAPFDGRVQRRLLDEGAVINAGTPVLNLVSERVLEVITGLPADVVSSLSKDSNYKGYTAEKTISLTLSRILPDINPITRTQGVKFKLPDDSELSSNEYIKLAISHNEPQEGFWIPNNALLEGPRGVWEIFALTEDNRVKKYSVEVIYPSNPESYVSSALLDGTKVVIEGVHRLATGVSVTISQTAEAR